MSRGKPIYGLDVSSHQGYPDWGRIKREGFSFAFTKASEGTYYRNPTYAHNMKGMLANGIVRGVYHYLTNESASAQLDNFFAVTGKIASGVMVCVDVEEVPGMPPPTWGRVKEFVAGLKKRLGDDRPIVIYSGAWFWAGGSGAGRLDNPKLSDLPGEIVVWSSNYVNGSGYASTLYQKMPASWWDTAFWGGRRPDIIQFSASANIGGMGEVDANAFAGTVEELEAIGLPAGTTPKPEPEDPEKPDEPEKPKEAYVVSVAEQTSGGTWLYKDRAEARIEKLAKLGVKATLLTKDAPVVDPDKPPVKKPEKVEGPSLAGIVVESGGIRRAAKMYSPFNHYRPGAPAQIYHKGEDIECPTMTPHFVLPDEIVVQAVWDYDSVGGYHQAIMYYVPELKLYVLHGHIHSGVSKWYEAGDRVKRGDIIARGGTVYDSMGTSPHLHLQCTYERAAAFALGSAFNNAAVDPAKHFRNKFREFPAPSSAAALEEFDSRSSAWHEETGCLTDVANLVESLDELDPVSVATSCLDPDGDPLMAKRVA